MATLILAVSFSICISALCSLLESILYSTPHITLESASARGEDQASGMIRLKSNVEVPLTAILILNTVANTAGASLAGWAAGQVWGVKYLWVFSLVFTLAILLFSEIIPKTVGAVHWPLLWRHSVKPLDVMVAATKPFIKLLRLVTNLIIRSGPEMVIVSEDDILAAARLGAREGEITIMEHNLIHNIIKLEDLKAEDIMTPRTVIFSANGDTPVFKLKKEARTWQYSRIPVWVGGREDFQGYVLRRDVANADSGKENLVLKEILHAPVRFVPNTANALNLLSSFLRRKEHMYMVVDEYGGIMGLVTLEDVLESLVGSEIVDETDTVADLQVLARRRGATVLKFEDLLKEPEEEKKQ